MLSGFISFSISPELSGPWNILDINDYKRQVYLNEVLNCKGIAKKSVV